MSLTGDILTAATSLITGLSLSPTPAIKARKRRALLDGEAPPAVLLAVQETSAQRQTSGGVYEVKYELTACIAYTSSGKAGDNTTLRSWSDDVEGVLSRGENWHALGTPLNVDDVFPGQRLLFEDAAGRVMLDWSVIRQTVQVREQR